jgi:prolipoprotein diacylglyceryltransferase
MSFPVYFHLGPFLIHPHLLFEMLAYALGFRLYLELRRTQGDRLADADRWWVIAASSVGAVAGSKLLFLLEAPRQSLERLGQPLSLFSGKTIVGALIGGLFAVELTKRVLGIRTRTGDLFALPLCLGIATGRVGCFLTGLDDQTGGTPTRLPWGINFGDGAPRHPTQLYEIFFVVLLGIVIFALSRRPHFDGDLFKVFMVGYFVFRLGCDFLKPGVRVFAGLSSIQCACLAMILYYLSDVFRWLRLSGYSVGTVKASPFAESTMKNV